MNPDKFLETIAHTNSGAIDDRLAVTPPSLDLSKYRAMASDIDASPADMDELLRTLWEIMRGFVEDGFDVKNIPAFLPEIFDEASGASGREVESPDEEDCHDKT